MNVNLSAVTNALNFIDSNYSTEDDAEISLEVFVKKQGYDYREMSIQLSLLSAWNINEYKEFIISIEKRYEKECKSQADLLYHFLTDTNNNWRDSHPGRVRLINDKTKYSDYSLVKISCTKITMDGIKDVIMEVFKFIYSDDKMRRLHVKLTDLDRKLKKRFIPSRKFKPIQDNIDTPTFSLN